MDRTEPGHSWQRARLAGERLEFEAQDGLRNALLDGFFFVERPSMALEPGDRFARSFYLPAEPENPDGYRGFRRWTTNNVGPRQGYFRRGEDQTEQFFLESRHWDRIYPPALASQAREMRDLALGILRAVLAELDIPEDLWDEATGGSLLLNGAYHLTFNHFRPEIATRGLNVHKDSGWVTVLRSVEPGLEVEHDGVWSPIAPTPGTFIVNFGCAMEILTRECATPVAAVAHRVVRQQQRTAPDRYSYALFVDSSLDTEISPGLFSYQPGRGLVLVADFAEFLTEIVSKTYQRESTGLY